MKKIVMIGIIAVLLFSLAGFAYAAPKALPAGTLVSATCNGDNTATVKIDGVTVKDFHKYYYFADREILGPMQKTTFNLDESRRFQFTHSGGYFAGLAREMGKKYNGASFLGPNIDLDDKDGPAFVITCPVVKIK